MCLFILIKTFSFNLKSILNYIHTHTHTHTHTCMSFPGGSDDKESACNGGEPGFSPWAGKISWRRAWQPTLIFLPGESHEQRSLMGYSPWGCKESDTTERLNIAHIHIDVYIKSIPLFFPLLESRVSSQTGKNWLRLNFKQFHSYFLF